MRIKLIFVLLMISLLLVACGGEISEELAKEKFDSIRENSLYNQHFDESLVEMRLNKKDYDKETGIVPYSFFANVEPSFNKLSNSGKYQFIRRILEEFEGDLECSGDTPCRLETIILTYIDNEGDEDTKNYHYMIADDRIMVDGKFIDQK